MLCDRFITRIVRVRAITLVSGWTTQVERERELGVARLRRGTVIGAGVWPIAKNRASRRLSAS